MSGTNEEKDLTFEEGLKKLDEMTKELDREDISLAEATDLYKEAKLLADKLYDILNKASLSIKDLEGNDIDVILE